MFNLLKDFFLFKKQLPNTFLEASDMHITVFRLLKRIRHYNNEIFKIKLKEINGLGWKLIIGK
jgi:hypothetical protein